MESLLTGVSVDGAVSSIPFVSVSGKGQFFLFGFEVDRTLISN